MPASRKEQIKKAIEDENLVVLEQIESEHPGSALSVILEMYKFPLHHAANHALVTMTTFLLNHGFLANHLSSTPREAPALHFALQRPMSGISTKDYNRKLEIANMLAESGPAMIAYCDQEMGENAFHKACQFGFHAFISHCLNSKNPVIRDFSEQAATAENFSGHTPLHKAILSGDFDCVITLIQLYNRTDLDLEPYLAFARENHAISSIIEELRVNLGHIPDQVLADGGTKNKLDNHVPAG